MTEAQIVQDLVTSAPDIATKAADAKSLFAAGSLPKPAALKKIAATVLIPDRPRISGDEATVSVTVRAVGDKELGKVEWVLVKEQDQWKIKSAPLP